MRDVNLRIARIELKEGQTRRAILRLKQLQGRSPSSHAGQEARAELERLVKSGIALARTDTPTEQLANLEWLLKERRFEEALEPAKMFLDSIKGQHRRAERLRVLEMLARIYRETRRDKDALATHDEIQRLSGVLNSCSVHAYRLWRVTMTAERTILRRFRGKKSRLYWRKLADFRYDLGNMKRPMMRT